MTNKVTWERTANGYKSTIHVDITQDASPGLTVKVAWERTDNGFAYGIIFPHGDPWIFSSKAATEQELLQEIQNGLPGRTVEVITIEEHNRLKAAYKRKRGY